MPGRGELDLVATQLFFNCVTLGYLGDLSVSTLAGLQGLAILSLLPKSALTAAIL